MIQANKFLLVCTSVGLILITGGYATLSYRESKTAVKGVQTNISTTPTLLPSPTPTPSPTSIPTPTRIQETPQTKQYGGWYWRPELNRAQRWLGTDSQGNDMWSDTGDPPPTPTAEPQKSTSEGFFQTRKVTTTDGISASVKQTIVELKVSQIKR